MRPLIVGNIATPIKKEENRANIPPDHTHRWTISVRGLLDEDLTYMVKRVQFKLHETYANALRSVDSPPWEVTETGWGEFAIAVKIHFVSEASEKPITLYHHLALHPFGPDKDLAKEQNRPVHSFQYEEVVFNEPTEAFYDVLTKRPAPELPAKRNSKEKYALDTEGEENDRLTESIEKMKEMNKEMKEKLLEKEAALAEMKAAAGKAQKDK